MDSVRYLSLQCSPVHQFSSLQPVKEYLDWVSGVNADDPPETRRDKLRRLFQSAWQTERGADRRADGRGGVERPGARKPMPTSASC